MTMEVALGLIPEKTINDYADIECTVFGDILLQAMGIGSGCALFKRDEYTGCYTLGWVSDDGEIYDARFDLETILRSLKGKGLTVTVKVDNS